MLSYTQFTDATMFLKSYSDALKCVDQIAENRIAVTHYNQAAENITGGIEADQVSVLGG